MMRSGESQLTGNTAGKLTGNVANYVHKVFIEVPANPLLKFLPGQSINAKCHQVLYHVTSLCPSQPQSTDTFFATRKEAVAAWKR